MKRFTKHLRDQFSIGPSHGNDHLDGETQLNDALNSRDFSLSKVGRYGFPYHSTCLALDPVQRLIAIGTSSGSIRICGKPGAECHVNHDSSAAVHHLLFLINEGGLISVCEDASLHLWNLRQKQPALINTLKFNKEKITAIHSPFPSKWLYVGTERGNIYIVNIEQFAISGYMISWNHVIDVSHKGHPGPVLQISSSPQDHNKLLLSYESGISVLWDLKTKKLSHSYRMENAVQYITCSAWSLDGKQFIAGHWDGHVSTWNFRNAKKPEDISMPHGSGKSASDFSSNKDGVCCAITKIEHHGSGQGEPPIIIFSGGMPYGNNRRGITIMRGRSKTMLLTDHVIDFQCLVSSPYPTENPPEALVVLLRNEIVVFDLMAPSTPSIPWFTLPYTFNIHETPVTCVQFYPECPNKLLLALHSLKPTATPESNESSRRKWPINGGQDGETNQEPCLIITGHADGTLKFWDATSNMLIICTRTRISKLFERDMSRQSSTTSNLSKKSSVEQYEDPFAIQHLCLCPMSRTLAAVTASYFMVVFKFSTKPTQTETPMIDVNFSVEIGQECSADSPTSDGSNSYDGQHHPLDRMTSSASTHFPSSLLYHPPLKAGSHRWPPGFQPEVIFQQVADEPMPNITSVALSSSYGLVAFGNTIGVALLDYLQKKPLMILMNYELGVPGDWIETGGTSPTRTNPSPSPSMVNGLDSDSDSRKDGMVSPSMNSSHDKKKERVSRMFSTANENAHNKLSKKGSSASNGSLSSREKEDGGGCSKDKEVATAGSISALEFSYSYTRKGANVVCPALWVGTSLGTTSVIVLSLPPTQERLVQSVHAINTGTVLDYHHCILNITHLDEYGNIESAPFSCWKESESSSSSNKTTSYQKQQVFSSECSKKLFAVITTEKAIKVCSLPSMRLHTSVGPVDADSFIIKAEAMVVGDGNCIGCLTSNGHVTIYSLPSLRVLLDVDCGISLADYRMIRTFNFGKGGEGIFLTSATEIQRISFTLEKSEAFVDGLGCLFTMRPTPDPPPKGFFQSFFTQGASTLDRDELFGPKSGTASHTLAERVPGSGMTALRANADTVGGAMSRAKMALIERGEKLSELEDKTAQMNARAHNFSSAAQALADKYQRKKWYQL